MITPASTIGELEARARITDRREFWMPYAGDPRGFELGVAELKRRILLLEQERKS